MSKVTQVNTEIKTCTDTEIEKLKWQIINLKNALEFTYKEKGI